MGRAVIKGGNYIEQKSKKWSAEEISVLNEVYPNGGIKESIKRINRSANSIQLKANRLGLKTKHHTVNKNYFSNIDTRNKAYWLGFISADGYVVSNKSGGNFELGIELSYKDRDHLKAFLSEIEGDYDITTRIKKPFVKYGYDSEYKTSIVRIYSKKIVADLIKLGVTPKKTSIIKMPKIQDEFLWDYIRGFFDGDGSFSEFCNGGHKYARISFVCKSVSYIDSLFHILDEYELNPKMYYDKKSDCKQIQIRKQSCVKKFCSLIYSNSEIYLQRKYDKYYNYYYNKLPA